MNSKNTWQFIDTLWDKSVIPTLQNYIKIPNKSPAFDSNWAEHGYMDQAAELLANWCQSQAIPGMQLEIIRHPGLTPLIYIDIAGTVDKTVLLYGHLDKQPEMTGWNPGLGPWQPVLQGDQLYGRGSADDGYAVFAALSSIMALQQQGLPHPRCVILIEASEESGSPDLIHYLEHLRPRLGTPDLIICLDSGCGNYEQLWCTTSLRGLISGTLNIEVLTEGVHSGNGGGIIPNPFLILRQLLTRIETEQTGQIFPEAFNVPLSPQRQQQAQLTAATLQQQIYTEFPFVAGTQPLNFDTVELQLNRTLRPALSIIGIDGVPKIANAGNVLLPHIQVQLSLRLPPTCDVAQAAKTLQQLLESNPPFGANVSFQCNSPSSGWDSPIMPESLLTAINQASLHYFTKPAMYMGEGGSIPFMAVLGKQFPQAQFLITGVLGPRSNAHGPNEFLHIPTAKKVTCCVAEIIAGMQ
ncbi:M20 family metallopeptidase [soil metagenome]